MQLLTCTSAPELQMLHQCSWVVSNPPAAELLTYSMHARWTPLEHFHHLSVPDLEEILGLWQRQNPAVFCLQTPLCLQVPNVTIPITSSLCSKGWVQQTSKQCLLCPASQYSFQPNKTECNTPCPPNANCTGGANMVPLEGYWVSAADSDSIVACPNSEACQGNRTELALCLAQAYGQAEQLEVCSFYFSTASAAMDQKGNWLVCDAAFASLCHAFSNLKREFDTFSDVDA